VQNPDMSYSLYYRESQVRCALYYANGTWWGTGFVASSSMAKRAKVAWYEDVRDLRLRTLWTGSGFISMLLHSGLCMRCLIVRFSLGFHVPAGAQIAWLEATQLERGLRWAVPLPCRTKHLRAPTPGACVFLRAAC